jgi:hypothetical protein
MATPLSLNPKITQVGLALFPAPAQQGFSLTLTHVALGTSKYDPTGTETALKTEVARYAITSGTNPSPRQVQVGLTITDLDATGRTPNGKSIGEIGFYSNNTLFAVWSVAAGDPLFVKTEAFDVPMAYTMDISALPASSVTVTPNVNKAGLETLILSHESKQNPHTQYAPLASPAFTGNPTAPTPSQFDADTSLATTAFVQRALGNRQSLIGVSGSYKVVPADMGKIIYIQGIDGAALILPPANSVLLGSSIAVLNLNAGGVTIGRPSTGAGSTDLIQYGIGSAESSSIGQGEFLELISDGSAQWFPAARTTGLGLLPSFASVRSQNGYQKLPSGLIMQWGLASAGTDANGAIISFPVVFPNLALIVVASNTDASCAASAAQVISAATFKLWGRSYTGAYNVFNFYWYAIGY